MTFNGDWKEDSATMISILQNVDFYSGTERKKMLKVPKKIGGSMLYGLTWRSWLSPTKTRTYDPVTGLYYTKVVDDYPELKDIFKEFADYHLPQFPFTQVQMNKNFPCPPHKDSSNIGESCLCVFGDFPQGQGGTCVKLENGLTVKLDARQQPEIFDGAKYEHWVEPYDTGTRYSLVFFNNKLLDKKIKAYQEKSNTNL
tara:strand:- start:1788 stop:2384 length:597 start_codon:yes stop_codon:yes gene_type:complete